MIRRLPDPGTPTCDHCGVSPGQNHKIRCRLTWELQSSWWMRHYWTLAFAAAALVSLAVYHLTGGTP